MFLLLSALLLQQDPVAVLIEKLGSDSVEERDDASRELRLRIFEAQEALEEAGRSADLEVASRARTILESLADYRKEAARELFLLLNHARSEFDDGHFDHCARICDLALYLAPGLRPVEELRWDALQGCWSAGHEEVGRTLRAAWIRLPHPEKWRSLKERIRRNYPDDDWEETSVQRKLATLRLDLAFQNATAEEILGTLRDLSGLPIAVDDASRELIDVERKISLVSKGETLGQILCSLAGQLGARCVVTEEKVVLLSVHAGLREVFPLEERNPDRY